MVAENEKLDSNEIQTLTDNLGCLFTDEELRQAVEESVLIIPLHEIKKVKTNYLNGLDKIFNRDVEQFDFSVSDAHRDTLLMIVNNLHFRLNRFAEALKLQSTPKVQLSPTNIHIARAIIQLAVDIGLSR